MLEILARPSDVWCGRAGFEPALSQTCLADGLRRNPTPQEFLPWLVLRGVPWSKKREPSGVSLVSWGISPQVS